MAAAFIVDDMMQNVPEEDMTGRELSEQLTSELDFLEDKTDNSGDTWVFDPEGNILSKNGSAYEGNFFDELNSISREHERKAADPTVLSRTNDRESYTFWVGENDILLLRQKCCVIRQMYGGDFYLGVLNYGGREAALQRRQFSRLMAIDIFLLLILIVLIVNNNSRYRRQIIRAATIDELTGLANRKSFNSEYREYINSVQTATHDSSMFLLDIDYFKQINDNYGHASGDAALRYLGGELSKLTGKYGGFAGRWGGDEFIGVLPVSASELSDILGGLCRSIEAAVMDDGFRMTISAGASAIQPGEDLAAASEQADLALYEAKESGRNRACLYTGSLPATEAAAKKTYSVENALKKAEEIRIPENTQKSPDQTVPSVSIPFRERMAEYVREKLIMSTILGVRWMAPFVAGGGILIALAFLFDSASIDIASLSVAERANFGSITAIAASLKEIGGVTFNFMLPVFAGFMAYGIAGEEAFVAGFVGGFMTIDSNSGFVGAMIAGFFAGVIVNEMKQFTGYMPSFIRNAAPIILFPVFSLLMMRLITLSVITPVSSALGRFFTGALEDAVSMSTLLGGGLSGMMMAFDMGGIINKVAYNYGVEGLTSGGEVIMASVMIGGMVPPIGIFLSSFFFKNKFTEDEKGRGPGALFMGLSFITEGALPYVFTDIARVIPSCMAGSALAGLLSAAFGCALPAPHGGIFVIPVMTHPLLYLLALLAGSALTAVILGMLKREVRE